MRQELFKFDDDGVIYTFTSSNKAVVYNGDTYIPVTMGRDKISVSSSLTKAKLVIKISINNSTAKSWLTVPREAYLHLTMYTKIDNADPTITWRGKLASIGYDKKHAVLTFDNKFTSLRRSGMRRKYQRACPFALYGHECRVNINNHRVYTAVATISGNTITCADAALQTDGFYSGGMVQRQSDGKARYIIKHVGDTLTLARPFNELEANDNIYIAAGCNKSLTTCVGRFDNGRQFGGFPFIPTTNPFGGTSIA